MYNLCKYLKCFSIFSSLNKDISCQIPIHIMIFNSHDEGFAKQPAPPQCIKSLCYAVNKPPSHYFSSRNCSTLFSKHMGVFGVTFCTLYDLLSLLYHSDRKYACSCAKISILPITLPELKLETCVL